MEEAGLKIRYYFCETSRKYLYVDCKDCRKKKMKYILRDGTYELVLFDNVHMHPRRLNERLTKNDRKRHMKRLNIVDEILALPKDMLISDLEETIRTKHNIHSQKKFIELVRMASHMNCTVQNVTSKLLDMGCTVWDKLDSDIECNITNM